MSEDKLPKDLSFSGLVSTVKSAKPTKVLGLAKGSSSINAKLKYGKGSYWVGKVSASASNDLGFRLIFDKNFSFKSTNASATQFLLKNTRFTA